MFIPHQQKHIQFLLIRFTNTENEAEHLLLTVPFSVLIYSKPNIYIKVRIHLHFARIISLSGFKISVPF